MAYTIGIFFIRLDNKLLICHPTGHPADVWTIPKGMPDEDDADYFETGIRELQEETNISYNEIKNDVSNILRMENVLYKTNKKELISYLIKYSGNCEFNLKCNSFVRGNDYDFPEVDDYKWVDLHDAVNMVHESQSKIVSELIRLIK